MNQRFFSLEQISEEWGNTPESVKGLVESLLATATLSEKESRLIQFLDATPIGIAVHDSTGHMIYINQIGRALLGIHQSAQVDLNQLADFFQIYQAGTQQLYPVEALPSTRALSGEAVWVDDLEVHQADRVVPLEVWATPIFDDQKQVIYAIAAFQDISERKRQESDHKRRELERQILKNTVLRSEYRRYHQVIQAQTDLILRSLPDTTITFANDALCLAVGYTLSDVIGMQWSNFIPPEEISVVRDKIAALTPEDPIFENINQDYRSNHQIGWTHWVNLGIFNEVGELLEIQSVGRDITELQEKILREQALTRVFQAIRNSLDLQTIFATATAETAQLLKPLDCFVVQYLSDLGIWRHIAEFRHSPDTSTTLGLEIPDTGNPFAEQLKQLQRVQVEDTFHLNDAINCEVAQTLPGAWLLIPLVIEGKLWGSFTISTIQHPFVWQADQVELAQSVADQLEIAIQQANLYQQVQLELEERRRVEVALRESETRFQNMAANIPGAIICCGLMGLTVCCT
jgi:PAS domain S-box-containing protein